MSTMQTPTRTNPDAQPTPPRAGVRSHRVWVDTVQRRDEARTLLNTLLEAKHVSERNLASINRPDMIKKVTGKSSMDTAIDSTRRLIDSFDRVLVDLKSTLSDEDIALLDETDPAA